MSVPRLLVFLAPALLASGFAEAQDKATSQDRAAVESCLAKAKAAKRGPETCIGTVQGPCTNAPGGDTTMGMKECGGREITVWDERLNAAYRAALSGYVGKQPAMRDTGTTTGANVLREAQRAWITFRDKKCDAAGLPVAGGTGASLLSTDCYLQETARQAIWLDGLNAGEQ